MLRVNCTAAEKRRRSHQIQAQAGSLVRGSSPHPLPGDMDTRCDTMPNEAEAFSKRGKPTPVPYSSVKSEDVTSASTSDWHLSRRVENPQRALHGDSGGEGVECAPTTAPSAPPTPVPLQCPSRGQRRHGRRLARATCRASTSAQPRKRRCDQYAARDETSAPMWRGDSRDDG